MTARYFVSPPLNHGECVLDGPEAHHCLHVMRAVIGDPITLFDGEGREATGVIVASDRRSVTVSVGDVRQVDLESECQLWLAVALPKGDRQKWLVEKCVELGVKTLVPLVTHRSVAQPTDKALERLRRSVIESSKQCGRNTLMKIEPPIQFSDCVSADSPPSSGSPASNSANAVRWIAHPLGGSWAAGPPPSSVFAAIGPEGGFTDDEVQLALGCGWATISLGQRILRVETAALAVAAALMLASNQSQS